jgi:site-specific DNA-methyltransferase (adenine-specific)
LERKRTYGETRGSKTVRASKLEDAPEVPKFASLADYRLFTEKWIRQSLSQGLEEGGFMIIWTNTLGKNIIVDVCASLGYFMTGEYCWAKTTKIQNKIASLPGKYRHFHEISSLDSETLLRVYESALIFAPHKTVNPQLDDNLIRKRPRLGEKEGELIPRSSIPWTVATSYHDRDESGGTIAHSHPCHKPLPALLPLLSTWTYPGDIILDPFAGSGGIRRAVEELNILTQTQFHHERSPSASLDDMRISKCRQYAGVEILSHWVDENRV